MPKQRTNKSISKRFKITKTGKVLRGQSFNRHLKVSKSASHKRALGGMVRMKDSFAKRIIKATGVRIHRKENN